MAEWLVERGIGETREALVDNGRIVEARIRLEGTIAAGSVLSARLVDIGKAGRLAVARDAQANEYLLPSAPRGVSEGSQIEIEVVREAIPGIEPWKRPLARRAGEGVPVRSDELIPARRDLVFPNAGRDELADAGWDELIEQAASGVIEFDGGSLRIFVTPAMTLIDVDGFLPPADLAVRGAAEAARAIRRLDIGGSIGIDLPTVSGKAARQSAAAAVDANLPQPFERTAVNGFGFVQIVRPRQRASLAEIWSERASAEARSLLRRISLSRAGACRLAAHPAIIAVIERHPDWTEALSRQIGGAVSLRADPSLAMSGGHAEPI